jgi:hypothetical protein
MVCFGGNGDCVGVNLPGSATTSRQLSCWR